MGSLLTAVSSSLPRAASKLSYPRAPRSFSRRAWKESSPGEEVLHLPCWPPSPRPGGRGAAGRMCRPLRFLVRLMGPD